MHLIFVVEKDNNSYAAHLKYKAISTYGNKKMPMHFALLWSFDTKYANGILYNDEQWCKFQERNMREKTSHRGRIPRNSGIIQFVYLLQNCSLIYLTSGVNFLEKIFFWGNIFVQNIENLMKVNKTRILDPQQHQTPF